ncbi:hypothetical protein IV203_001785 [Nitzschia inconspicua]|uniref:Stc1 domain-containing protein n=1 Tax=Nitzschia inconspicua TaxID=303405 RepID=A0A9K3L7L2_9STRA|nr:hypothetical protein IV203_001785 [Nitzschia inconspicua]
MSTPVVTSRWAGNFDCSVCRRKRLMADEFSRNMIQKHRTNGVPLKCKQCTSKMEQEEREQAKRNANIRNKDNNNDNNNNNDTTTTTTTNDVVSTQETRKCAGSCNQVLSQSEYNRNQWAKGEGKSRCRRCVEQSLQEEATQQQESRDAKIETARRKVEALKLNKTGTTKTTSQEIVAAESELAALQAEKVTGLKPIKLSSSGRGGRGRGRTAGRGSMRGGIR